MANLKQKYIRRVIALLTAFVMLFAAIPYGVFADDTAVEEGGSTGDNTAAGTLTMGEGVSVEGETLYSFTPETDDIYRFYSEYEGTEYVDPISYLYDENMEQIAENDDGGNEMNFELCAELKAGKTYYLKVEFISGTAPIMLYVDKSDVVSIKYISGGSYEYIYQDQANGRWVGTHDEQIVDRYFEYYSYRLAQDIVFEVTYRNGETAQLDCATDEVEGLVVESDQYENPWAVGSDNIAYINYKGLTAPFNVTVVPSPVKSISVASGGELEFIKQDIQYGWWSTYYFDLEVDRYFVYDTYYIADSLVLNVEYNDGTTAEITSWGDEGQQIHAYANQYLNPWTVGEKNTVEISHMGTAIELPVTIVESPVKNLSIASGGEFEYPENDESYGYWETKWETNEQFFRYHTNHAVNDVVLNVEYTDGTSETVPYGSTGMSYTDNQYYVPWTVGGENLITIYYKGAQVTLSAKVLPSPIESITVNDFSIMEGTNGWHNTYTNNGVSTRWYCYSVEPELITIKYTDGTEITGTRSEIEAQTGKSISITSNQQYWSQWGVGTHPVTISFMGKQGSYNITIEESPFASISVDDITLTEKTDGHWRDGYWLNGEYIYEEWFLYSINIPCFTVTYKDGTVITGTQQEIYDQTGYQPEIYTEQSYNNQWGVGEHRVTIVLPGVSYEGKVTIVESAIDSIEVIDTNGFKYYENDELSGSWQEDGIFIYNAWYLASNVTIKVNYKDGTSENVSYYNEGGSYTGLDFSSSQRATPWTVGGENIVTITYKGAKTQISAVVEPSPVASIVVEPITVTEYVGGAWNNLWLEGADEPVRWFEYSVTPYALTVNFTDGTSFTGTPDELVTQYGSNISVSHDQSYENQWGIGSHTARISYLGKSAEFTINVEASPIASVVIDPVYCIENYSGWVQDGYWYEGEYIDEKWFYYNIDPANITITMTDGTVHTGQYTEVLNQLGYEYGTSSDQGFENQWGVGEHTARLNVSGIDYEYTVVVTENPIASIEIEPMVFTEYQGGWWTSSYYEDENGNGEYISWYCYPDVPENITITYKDGTVVSGTDAEIGEQTGYYGSYYSGQNYDNQLGVGEHTATVVFMGFTSEYTIIIEPSPVVSVEVPEITLIENCDGYMNTTYLSDENGQPYEIQWFTYNIYIDTVTINYRDGSTISGTPEEIYNQTGYGVEVYTSQSHDNPWGVGEHTAEIEFMGQRFEFTVNVVETPVESIVVEPVIRNSENNAGYNSGYNDPETGEWIEEEWISYEEYPERLTVNYKDGTSFTGTPDELHQNGKYYISYTSDQSYFNQWGVGVHTATLSFMGFTTEYTVEVVENITGDVFTYYVTSEDNAVISGYVGSDTDIVIPEQIDGYTVVGIDDFAFRYTGVENVSIPVSVTWIGEQAFYNCQIKTLRFYNTTTVIEDYAFGACFNLTDVYFIGTEADAGNITIGLENSYLTDATWHYIAECEEHVYDSDCDDACNNCGEMREANHAWRWVVDYYGTCTENGYQHEECSNCGKARNYDTVIEAPGEHQDVGVTGDYEPTCSNIGYTGDIYCYTCNTIIAIGENIPATGEHINTELMWASNPVCGNDGYTGDLYCHDCGTVVEYGETIPATGEHPSTELRGAYDPVCGNDGYTGDLYCTECGVLVSYGEVIPSAGEHTGVSLTGDYEPTCGNEGYTGDLYCTDCGSIISLGESIPATGEHQNTGLSGDYSATCGSFGYTGNIICHDCGTVISYGKEIPATGKHIYTDGNDDTCNNCGYTRDLNAIPHISLDNGSALPGKEITLDLKIDQNVGFSALHLGLIYDNSVLTLTKVENLLPDFSMLSANSIVFDGDYDYTENGVIARLTFLVAEDALNGNYEIGVSVMSASNTAFEAVEMVGVLGVIEVYNLVYGDASGDGVVNAVDLSMLRAYLAAKDPETGISTVTLSSGADANCDGVVDTIDLAMVRKYLAYFDPATGESSVVLGPQAS